MGNSFGYLDDAGNAEFLQAVRKVLVPGGRFLLDAGSVAENVLPGMKDHTEMEFGGIWFLEDNRFDKERRRLETSYTFIKDRRTEEKFGSHRIYTLREFATLLSDAGFTGLKSFGSADGEPFEPGKTGLFLIAGKDST
jgi:hypothetical protein